MLSGTASSQAEAHVEGMRAGFDRMLASGLIDDPRVLHLNFRDIASDPVGAVRQVYARQGLAVPPDLEARVHAWLADPENAADRYGRYNYSYETFGLDKAWIEDLFSDYSKRFALA